MPTKRLLKEYFLFSRNDRIAVITLLVLIALAWSLPFLFDPGSTPSVSQDTGWKRIVDNMTKPVDGGPYREEGAQASGSDNKNSGDKYNNAATGRMFTFDPNRLGPDGWRELGVRDRTIGTILKYREKGGRFRQPADLSRIYGLQPGLVERLIPFVRIIDGDNNPKPLRSNITAGHNYQEQQFQPAAGISGQLRSSRAFGTRANRGQPVYQKKSYQPVDLNLTDTTALIALPCIGSKLAVRILQFRDRLGGFHSIEQVREVYGITDSSFAVIRPWLRADPTGCRLIAINQVSMEELKVHPYVRYELARTIIAYRQEHGGFTELEDMRKITALSSAAYEKIRPYLRL